MPLCESCKKLVKISLTRHFHNKYKKNGFVLSVPLPCESRKALCRVDDIEDYALSIYQEMDQFGEANDMVSLSQRASDRNDQMYDFSVRLKENKMQSHFAWVKLHDDVRQG